MAKKTVYMVQKVMLEYDGKDINSLSRAIKRLKESPNCNAVYSTESYRKSKQKVKAYFSEPKQ